MFVAPDSASQFPHALKTQDISGTIASACIQCRTCLGSCSFLASRGTPGKIAQTCASRPDAGRAVAFECSLCGLCTSLCSRDLDPAAMFLALRQEAVNKKETDLSVYKKILSYEQKGVSKQFSYYSLPEDCDTVFFPGCTLPGTRPGQTLKAFEYLKTRIKNIGIVLDCCTKPSHDLGRKDFFSAMFTEMEEFLLKNKIRTIVVACPNCHKIFTTHGTKFQVKTLYEIMAGDLDSGNFFTETASATTRSVWSKELNAHTASVHDPCPVRHAHLVHKAVRALAGRQGLRLKEATFSREKALCCGEGGSVGCIKPDLAGNWAKKRKTEAGERPILTYCAGCVNSLSRGGARTFHILDLVFNPQKTISGKADVAKAPFTYLNRLNLKRKLKKEEKNQPGAVFRERTFCHGKNPPTHSMGRLFILGLALIALVSLLPRI